MAIALLPLSLPAQSAPPLAFAGLQTTITVPGLVAPAGVALASGNLFVLDRGGAQVIEIPANGSAPKTVASGLPAPTAIAADTGGNLYIATAAPAQVVKIAAGGGAPSPLSISGLASPAALAIDASGNVYIADPGAATVVKFTAGGAQTKLGSGWSAPTGVAVDLNGNIYVADKSLGYIVKVPAGGGAPVAIGAGLVSPASVAVDVSGNVIVGQASAGPLVEITPAASQTTIGGGSLQPLGLAAQGIGTVFVADGASNTVLEIQTVSVDFGNVNLCAAGQTTPAPCQRTLTLNYTVNAINNAAAPLVLTQGAPNLDFTLAAGSTCTGTIAAGSTCSVNVAFTPRAAGGRAGAIRIQDLGGNLLAQTFIHGAGNGAQMAYGPAVHATLYGPVVIDGTQITVEIIYGQVATDSAGNVYVASSHGILKIPSGGGSATVLQTGNAPTGVAVDGMGNIYASSQNGLVEIPSTTSGYGPTVGVPNGGILGHIGFDGAGNLYGLDHSGTVVELPAGGGAPINLGSVNDNNALTAGVAVDSAGDVFVGDTTALIRIPAGGSPQQIIATGAFLNHGVAVDAAGNVYAVNCVASGCGAIDYPVLEYPAGGGPPVTLGIGGEVGIAVDGAGSLYAAFGNQYVGFAVDDVEAYRLSASPPALSFATTVQGDVSPDSPQSVQIADAGNQSLSFSGISLASGTNFALTPGTGSPADCTTSTALPPGFSCNLSLAFIPAATGNFTDRLMLAENSFNGSPGAQSISLIGAGVPGSEPTATSLQASNTRSDYGQPVTLTATVSAALGTPVGSVTFLNGATVLGTATLNSSGVASLTSATIPIGANAIIASYPKTALFLASTSPAIAINVGNNAFSLSANVCASGQTKPAPCSQSLTITYDIQAAGALGVPKVVTQGVPNLDYTLAGTTCTGPVTAGSTCTVTVNFAPKFAGVRRGAVQIVDSGGNVLQTFFLGGVGAGPQVVFNQASPAPLTTGPLGADSITVDAAGNVFLAEDEYIFQVVEIPAGGGPSFTVGNLPNGLCIATNPLVVDGAGNIIISNWCESNVYKIPAGGGPAVVLFNAPSPIYSMSMDANGNLYFIGLDPTTFQSAVMELPAGSSSPILDFDLPGFAFGLAVDGAGNLFVSESDFNTGPVIDKFPVGGGTPVSIPVDYLPYNLVVDAAGDVFFPTGGSGVDEIPAGTASAIPLPLNLPDGFTLGSIAVDGAGNLIAAPEYGSGNAAVYVFPFSHPPTLSFAATVLKTTSADSPQSIEVQNVGNAPLTISKVKVDPNFIQAPGSGAPADCAGSASLAAGAICNLSISFIPTATGTLQGSAVLTDNALNVTGATQSIALSGIGAPKNTSALTLTSSLNPSTYGQVVTFTATVTAPSGGAPVGTVTFKHGGKLGSATLSNGVATFTTSTLAAGNSETITAVYAGNATDAGSSGTVSQTVQKTGTSNALASSLNPTLFGQPVTLTATVTSASGAIPVGNVNFKNGTAQLGSAPLTKNGVATLTTSRLPAGNPDNITAVYPGNGSFGSSTSSVLPQVIQAYATTTTLASSLNPSVVGQAVTFTATVVAASGPAPTGTVNFKKGGTLLGSSTLNNGVATFTTSALPAGNGENIAAVYAGNPPDSTSTSAALSQTVQKNQTTTALTSSPDPSAVGQTVTFTVRIASASGPPPTGSVNFRSGGTLLGTAQLANGTASFTTAALPAGKNNVTAVYSGDASNAGSSSVALTQTVQ